MKLTIDGKSIDAAAGRTILDAAEENGIRIPTLCYLREINCISVCRVCMVEADGKLVPACSTDAREGMTVVTDSERVRTARRKNLELICSDHRMDCTDCPRGADCELRALCQEFEVDDRAYGRGRRAEMADNSSPWLVRDNAKCILCRRCEAVCAKTQGVRAIAANRRGRETNVGFGLPLAETDCVGCGQCSAACPTGALVPRDDTKKVWKAIFDKELRVAAAVSPSAYLRVGELFGESPGTDCGGKTAAILRKLGIDRVYDLGDYEEAYEETMLALAAEKAEKSGKPVLSADCPAWRRYVETFFPEKAEQLLPATSCMEDLAARCKAGEKLFFVGIGSCTAAKGETGSVDAVLSTRELFQMICRACVSGFTARKIWAELKAEDFDSLPGASPGGKRKILPALSETAESGLRVASVTGLANAKSVLKREEQYDYIRVHACPGGCLNGGGMPAVKDKALGQPGEGGG